MGFLKVLLANAEADPMSATADGPHDASEWN